jgi:hypothetical protein
VLDTLWLAQALLQAQSLAVQGPMSRGEGMARAARHPRVLCHRSAARSPTQAPYGVGERAAKNVRQCSGSGTNDGTSAFWSRCQVRDGSVRLGLPANLPALLWDDSLWRCCAGWKTLGPFP